jgi:PleD family two-component response regulator
VAVLQSEDRGVDTLMSRADTAMYRAKTAGRDPLQL